MEFKTTLRILSYIIEIQGGLEGLAKHPLYYWVGSFVHLSVQPMRYKYTRPCTRSIKQGRWRNFYFQKVYKISFNCSGQWFEKIPKLTFSLWNAKRGRFQHKVRIILQFTNSLICRKKSCGFYWDTNQHSLELFTVNRQLFSEKVLALKAAETCRK